MDFKRIITLLLAIVMCVNLLASAFPSIAYASGGEKQIEASDMSIADEEQGAHGDSEKAETTNDTISTEESEKETPIELESEKVAGVGETEKAEETTEISKTEFQETDEEKLERLKEMVDTFPAEPELWWMDKDELTALYDTFTEICDLYESLDEEQQEQVEMRKLEAAGAFFASYVDPVSLANTGDIYSIPPEYGAGIIYQGRKSTAVYGPGWIDGRYATNYSKDNNVWIKYPESGSCYVDGQHVKADVLVYYWLSAGDAFVATSFGRDLISIGSPAWCGYEPQDFTVEMEYHFFRA